MRGKGHSGHKLRNYTVLITTVNNGGNFKTVCHWPSADKRPFRSVVYRQQQCTTLWPELIKFVQKFRCQIDNFQIHKVEKILKGSLNLIPSPSPVYFQKFADNAQQCFVFTPQANFPAHNLNSH